MSPASQHCGAARSPRRLLLPLCVALAVALPRAAAEEPDESDWVSIEQIQGAACERQCRVCDGRYIDPLEGEQRGAAPEESDINAAAERADLQGDTAFFYGGVSLSQGYRRLRGDTATIDRLGQTAVVEGNIVVREPGLALRGTRAELHRETGEALIEGGRFELHQQHLRGSAELLRRDDSGILHIDQGSLSFCPPGQDDWLLRAKRMDLDLEEGVGTARDARFSLGGVPVLYAPWLRFPLDDRRRTGFLFPNIGSDTRNGTDISVPVYFNLAPNYDALFAPRYISDRGFSWEGNLRYLDRTFGFWSVGGAFLDDDDRYREEVPEARNYDRWLINVQHSNLYRQRWRSRIDFSRVSDVDYVRDLDSSSIDTKRQANLLQLASFDYLGDRWLVNLDFQQFQSLAEDIREDYRKLPQLTATYRGEGTPFELGLIAEAQYSNFDSTTVRVTGQRAYAEAGLTYPMMWTAGYLRPTVKYRHLEYDLSDSLVQRDEERPSAGSALVNLDGGLFFERSTSLAGRSLLQTLEPRVYYLFSEYEDQSDQPDFDSAELTFNYNQLFRQTRFSGHDRLDDANQLSLGVTTRFIDDRDGREQFSASLGQIFYFRDRKVRVQPNGPALDDSRSELAGELLFNPTQRWTLNSTLVWDPFNDRINAANFSTTYKRDRGDIYSVSYTYRRPIALVGNQRVTDQLNTSAWIPINDRWTVFAALNYSLEANTSVEDMIGVEYDSCCWRVRLLHLRYFDTVPGRIPDFTNPNLEREQSFQIQIILKGLGGFGDRVENLLRDMIRGYDKRDFQ